MSFLARDSNAKIRRMWLATVWWKLQNLNLQVLADRTNGRAIGAVLRPSVVCDVMYCG